MLSLEARSQVIPVAEVVRSRQASRRITIFADSRVVEIIGIADFLHLRISAVPDSSVTPLQCPFQIFRIDDRIYRKPSPLKKIIGCCET